MKSRNIVPILLMPLFTAALFGCRMQHKVEEIRQNEMNVSLSLPPEMELRLRGIDTMKSEEPDTLVVSFEGREMLIMKAIKDEKTGEMIANEELQAAVVTARFRNVAERHGRVDIEFEVLVPDRMQDYDWQLRFRPTMWILEDTLDLEKVYVTGPGYRKAQLRGYEQYNRFLARILSDSTAFLDVRNLEIWIERNLPELYSFRGDTSFVSDEVFASYCGVTERQAIENYTLTAKLRWNDRLIARQGRMYARYVKAPIDTSRIRIDTILVPGSGDLVYRYIETIKTRPGLRKVDVTVDGDIWKQDQLVYDMPPTEPLTYYISSLATFVDPATRYCTRIVYRRAGVSASWDIDFAASKSEIDFSLGDNARRMENIRENIDRLIVNRSYDLDSVTITAFASPEGSVSANAEICRRRGNSVAEHFGKYVGHLADSLRREAGMVITVADDMTDSGMKRADVDIPKVNFIVKSGGENWNLLDVMVEDDSVMTDGEKADYKSIRESVASYDECEKVLSGRSYYAHLKNDLYPALRAVRFDFALHRKGMIRDTVHTTQVDTVYMNGVQAIRDRDYEKAVALLGPYRDFNLAVALVALDRNASAMEILGELDKTPRIKYLLALLYSREGDDSAAVKCYLEACREEPSYIHRGNLDPEISALIRKYDLGRVSEENNFEN